MLLRAPVEKIPKLLLHDRQFRKLPEFALPYDTHLGNSV